MSYAFIDGASLNHVITDIGRKYFNNERPNLDWSAIRGSHRKVFYYDALPVQDANEDENTYSARILPKVSELSTIERQNGYHVRTGDVIRRRKRGNEQKMVDVQLSVDALSMASRGLFSEASIITGDLDFRPLIVALIDMGIEVNVMYPVGETNEALLAAADVATPLNTSVIQKWFDYKHPRLLDFPKVHYTNGLPHNSEPDRIVSWDAGETYKQCGLYQISGRYCIYTNINNLFIDAGHTVMSSKNIETLKTYVKDVYGIDVPNS